MGTEAEIKMSRASNPVSPSLQGVLISPFPSHSDSSSVLEDKESKVMAHGWLTGAVDRRLCSPRLADLRSDHGPQEL